MSDVKVYSACIDGIPVKRNTVLEEDYLNVNNELTFWKLKAGVALERLAEVTEQLFTQEEVICSRGCASVTRIMLDVVPGEDGMGEEIYAKSVADVEALLGKQCDDIEALQDREAALREDLTRSNESAQKCIVSADRQHLRAVNAERERDALQKRLTVAEQRVQRMVDCSKGQDSVATGYLSDILTLLKRDVEGEGL